MKQKTFLPKAQTKAEKKWYLIDADGKVLGDLATQITMILRGKNTPQYTPHLDMGAYVVVINAAKVKVTGKKETDKSIIHHTGWRGSTTFEPIGELRVRKPEKIILSAVSGMIKRNRLKPSIMDKLKVYGGAEHPHVGQTQQLISL